MTVGVLPLAACGNRVSLVDVDNHFFAVVGHLVDEAHLGSLSWVLGLSGGDVVEGVPSEPASHPANGDELDDTGCARYIEVAGISVSLADVRRAMIVHPGAGRDG